MDEIDYKLEKIHNCVQLHSGNMKSEYPEQRLAIKYINPNSKVLELGSNIGINSIIISNILNNDKNLVTLECDVSHIDNLTYNRNINGLTFNIEPSALSSIPLARRGWHTFPITNGNVPENCVYVNTITYEQLLNKYNVIFDTIVADCEGALFYILKDIPYILDNISLLIVENDYILLEHKIFVDNVLLQYNFKNICSIPGGFTNSPCYNCFYEVWEKKQLINKQTYYYNNNYTHPINISFFNDDSIRVSSSYWKDDFGIFCKETNQIKFNYLGKGTMSISNNFITFENGGIWHKDNNQNIKVR